ncbi:LysR family transcriptional regulator [Saccharopolyspora gloriosae]|uniref:LysR family transcriptional regulator n=1 Tax=Saccharopolyspora gloriosae TaxID=455344 RepID=UPI001FB74D31|nr:LysR family transcriptional regulator [Saccharopolyspora gloriosae]
MEIRELRYFVAVAEEEHFGRAAHRLGMAQPPLSRAIQQLERRLGLTLLERNSRGVTLTDAGVVLLHEGRAAIGAVEAAERRTRRTAASGGGIVVVTKAEASAELLTKLLHRYAAEPDAVQVEVLLCGIGEQAPTLRDGRADVALLHLPHDDISGFDTETLHTENQVAVLPAGHPLSTRDELTLAEITSQPDLPMARWPDAAGRYAPGPGPEIHGHAQLLQLIGLGRTTTVLPESVRDAVRDDLATVPVVDAHPVSTLIAWPPQCRSRAVANFVRIATEL